MPAGMTGTLLAGRYRTIARVGSGGMATVLLAEDERLGRRVAVKRLHAESPENTARRFRREAQLGASLNHPNLVAVYDIETDDEGVLIVMEYVEGETLRDAIERGPLDPVRAVEVLRGVAEGLEHAHREGIVHRDVKPANVLLGRDGRIKLADLGIATAVEGTRLTMPGTVLGTAAYMAPEQLEGHKPGAAADVYSLAVVAWETLSGRRAYEGRTPMEIARRKAEERPPDLREAWPGAPPAAVEVLARAMGADPAARPATPTAFVHELARALDSPVYARHRPERPAWLVPLVALLVAVALGAGALFVLSGNGGSSDAGKRDAASPKQSKPAEPAPAEPSTSGYQVPQPTGNDAAAGSRLNAKGKALSDAGDYAAAIPVLERALRSYPPGTTASDLQFAYALFNLGHVLNAGGRPADAIPVLEERLKNPDQRATVQQELDAARAAANQG
jgi:serine/threonine protein kinase